MDKNLDPHHDVPRRSLGHLILSLVERAEANLVSALDELGVHGVLPEAPAPVLGFVAGGTRRPPGLLADVDVGQSPRLSLIKRDLRANHLTAAAAVRVSLDGVRRLARGQYLVVLRVRNGAFT